MTCVPLHSFTSLVQVIAGWGHSAAVCDNGDVYTCGRNFQGQLGLGDPNKFERNERNHPFLAQFRLIKGRHRRRTDARTHVVEGREGKGRARQAASD